MPTYEYRCKKNQHYFEVEQKMSDPPLQTCIECDGEVERLISAPTVFVKNSDKSAYVKDFRSDDRKWDAVTESIWGESASDLDKRVKKAGMD